MSLTTAFEERADERERAYAFLGLNREYYEALVGQLPAIDQDREPEAALAYVALIARFAVHHHHGRFADERLERQLLTIGWSLDRLAARLPADGYRPPAPSPRRRARHVLHVSTTVYATGGHTRTISRWIANDPDSSHSIVLTDQRSVAVPEWLTAAIAGSGGTVAVLAPDSRLARARRLRALAQQGFDTIVLHHFPDDIIPVVALATRDCPPVALLNHADHVFGVGASVADAFLNQREVGATLSAARRGARLNLVLPNPLAPQARKRSKAQARLALGLSSSETVVLSVGTEYKYAPTRERNFFRAASRILDASAQARVHVVGVPPQSACRYEQYFSHDRLHLLGSVDDPTLFQEAADVYIEGYPFGSQSALLEAAAAGAAPVRAYAPGTELLVASDACFAELAPIPASERAYVDGAVALIRDEFSRERLASALSARIRGHHTGASWRESLESSYAQISALTHDPRDIPTMTVRTDEEDLALSRWHGGRYEGAAGRRQYVDGRVAEIVNMAREFRRGGDYRAALGLLLAPARVFGALRRDVLLPLGALPLHWIRDRSRMSASAENRSPASKLPRTCDRASRPI